MRIASSNTVFSIKEVDVGLAADIGSLQRLPPKVSNDSLLRELALTARNFGVVEADKLGLISSTVQGSRKEVLIEALKMATLIAGESIPGSKRRRILKQARSKITGRSVGNEALAQLLDEPYRRRRTTVHQGMEHGYAPSRRLDRCLHRVRFYCFLLSSLFAAN